MAARVVQLMLAHLNAVHSLPKAAQVDKVMTRREAHHLQALQAVA